MFQLNLPKEDCQEVFDFIRTHLEVVNDTPAVEALMIALEEYLEEYLED